MMPSMPDIKSFCEVLKAEYKYLDTHSNTQMHLHGLFAFICTCGWKFRMQIFPELTTCRIESIVVPKKCFSYSPYSTNRFSAMSCSKTSLGRKKYSLPSTSFSFFGRLVSANKMRILTKYAYLTCFQPQSNGITFSAPSPKFHNMSKK